MPKTPKVNSEKSEKTRLRLIEAEQRAKVVDEFSKLDAELLPVKPKLRRHEDLSRLIRSWFVDANPEETLTAAGKNFEVVLSPAGMQTKLASAAELYRVMGHEKFLKASTLTLKALTETLEGGVVASLTSKERTGTRTLLPRKKAA